MPHADSIAPILSSIPPKSMRIFEGVMEKKAIGSLGVKWQATFVHAFTFFLFPPASAFESFAKGVTDVFFHAGTLCDLDRLPSCVRKGERTPAYHSNNHLSIVSY